MLLRNIRNALAFVFMLSCSFSWGQDWQQMYQDARGYYDRDWAKAVELLEKAIVVVENDLGKEDDHYAAVLNDLALGHWHLSDFDLAQELFNQSLDIKFQLYEGEGQEYAAALVNIAGLYQDLGDLNASVNLYLEAQKVYQKADMEGSAEYAVALNNMGTVYETAGNYNKALDFYGSSKSQGICFFIFSGFSDYSKNSMNKFVPDRIQHRHFVFP